MDINDNSREFFLHDKVLRLPITSFEIHEIQAFAEDIIGNVKVSHLIVGFLLIGSYMSGRFDRYSDIDFLVVTTKGKLENIFNAFLKILDDLPNVYIFTDMLSNDCIFTLQKTDRGLTKIDYDFVEVNALNDKLNHAYRIGPTLCSNNILYESGTIISDILKNSTNSVTLDVEKPIDPNSFIIQCWSMLRMLKRGEFWESFDILNNIRKHFIILLICKLYKEPFEEYRHLEIKFPEIVLNSLYETVTVPNISKLAKALVKTVVYFQKLWIANGNRITQNQHYIMDSIMQIAIDSTEKISKDVDRKDSK